MEQQQKEAAERLEKARLVSCFILNLTTINKENQYLSKPTVCASYPVLIRSHDLVTRTFAHGAKIQGFCESSLTSDVNVMRFTQKQKTRMT